MERTTTTHIHHTQDMHLYSVRPHVSPHTYTLLLYHVNMACFIFIADFVKLHADSRMNGGRVTALDIN